MLFGVMMFLHVSFACLMQWRMYVWHRGYLNQPSDVEAEVANTDLELIVSGGERQYGTVKECGYGDENSVAG